MLQEPDGVLLPQHADDETDRLGRALFKLGQGLGDGLSAGRIVPSIEPQLRAGHQ